MSQRRGPVITHADAGSPEGVVTGRVGDVYHRIDGASGGILYVKRSGTGNTGWEAETGWRDLLGQVVARATGAGNPAWSQMGATAYYAYKFALNDSVWTTYHIQHDYLAGSDLFLHAHWTTNGTSTNTVKWEFTYTYAKGFAQAAFDMASTATSATEAGAGTAWTHMTSEISTGISNTNFEVDGLLMVRIKRITNGGTDNADDVFLLMADCHYEVDRFATRNKAPNFYL